MTETNEYVTGITAEFISVFVTFLILPMLGLLNQ